MSGGGVWTSSGGGQRQAAPRVGDRGRGGEVEGVGRLKRKGKEAHLWGSDGEYYEGEGSGGSSCLGIGTVWKGEKLSRRGGYMTLARKCPCSLVALLFWMCPGKSSSPSFLGWHQPFQSPSSFTAIFSYHSFIKPDDILSSYPAALVGKEMGGGCKALVSFCCWKPLPVVESPPFPRVFASL